MTSCRGVSSCAYEECPLPFKSKGVSGCPVYTARHSYFKAGVKGDSKGEGLMGCRMSEVRLVRSQAGLPSLNE